MPEHTNEQPLVGARVVLRRHKPGDAAFFAHWYNQPELMYECALTEPTSEALERARIRRRLRSKDARWYTITTPDGRILGETGLLRLSPHWRCTDLSLTLPDPADQRRGYGTDALSLMLRLAFEGCGMNRVAVGVVAQNTPALSFYRRAGFLQEGIQEQGYYHGGAYSDFAMLRLLRAEWLRLQRA